MLWCITPYLVCRDLWQNCVNSKPASIREKQRMQTSLHTLDLSVLLQEVQKHKETLKNDTSLKTLHNTTLHES